MKEIGENFKVLVQYLLEQVVILVFINKFVHFFNEFQFLLFELSLAGWNAFLHIPEPEQQFELNMVKQTIEFEIAFKIFPSWWNDAVFKLPRSKGVLL